MRIIEAGPEWANRFWEFLCVIYPQVYPKHADTYRREMQKDHFKVYVAKLFEKKKNKKVWLALEGNTIIGGIAAEIVSDDTCEMKAFYVRFDRHNKKVGRRLFERFLVFSNNKRIRLDVVHYMKRTIAIYEHWGFKRTGESIEYPWEVSSAQRYEMRGIKMLKEP